MKKSIAAFCALFLLMLTLAACGGGASQPEQRIAGRWEPDGSAPFQAIEFIPHSDDPQRGKVNLSMMGNEISGQYEITPGEEQQRLAITYTLAMFPTTRAFYFTVEDDVLVLQEEESSVSVTYRRVTAKQTTNVPLRVICTADQLNRMFPQINQVRLGYLAGVLFCLHF